MKTLCIICCVFVLGCVAASAQNAAKPTQSGFKISGVVVDRLTGNPLANTVVNLGPVPGGRDDRSYKTGTDGRFFFEGLGKGKYSLSATRRGYALQAFDQHEGYSTAIAVGPGLESENLIFRLRPDASIRGTITDEQGEPAASVSVHLYEQQFREGENSINSVRQTNTDDRGEYFFSHLTEGTYYVAVSGRPWYSMGATRMVSTGSKDSELDQRIAQESRKMDAAYPLTFYSGATSSDDATPIYLHSGESFQSDMTLQAVPSVHLTVTVPASTEPNEAAPSGMVIMSRGARGFRQYNAPHIQLFANVFGRWEPAPNNGMFSTAEGVFGMYGIAPGHYLVQITPQGKDSPTYQELDLTGDMELTPGSGNALVRVSGTVLLNGAPPEAPTFLQLRSHMGQRSYGAQVTKGEFEFREAILPGRYEVLVGANGADLYLGSMSATGGKILGRSVLVTTGGNVQLSITAAQGLAELTGVANQDGKPKAGAMVLLVPADYQGDTILSHRDQSDSDGTFTLGRVRPGKYKVVAIEDGWTLSWADPKVLAPFLKDAPVYDLQPNQKVQVTVDVQKSQK